MDDLSTGKRNKRGDWVPNAPLVTSPLFRLPPQLTKLPGWLVGYFLPWNVLFMVTGALFWTFLFPSAAEMATYAWGWILKILILNLIAAALFYTALETPLYLRRRQANRFKYNGKFPGDIKNTAFWFSSQNAEGILRSLGTGVPIWTAYQVLLGHAAANGTALTVSFADHPIYLLALGFCVPVWHEFHFYCVHRLIHVPVLYKYIHSVHHNSVNPSPWSSLSMHPFEQMLYFSSCLIHLVIPSNPIIALYGLHYSGLGAVVGHIGFDKIELTDTRALDTHAYTHYLHHKYFEVNYGDGLMPLDKLFGSWHDGTAEGEAAMDARFARKKAKANTL